MFQTDRWSDLDPVIAEAIKFCPNSATLHYACANALGRRGRFQDSERHFLRAIDLDPSNADYLANLGALLVTIQFRRSSVDFS